MTKRWNTKSTIRLVSPEDTGLFSAYDSVSGECFELNEVAFRIMELLQHGCSSAELEETLRAEFETGMDLAADVELFLGQLAELGVIEAI